MRIDEITRPKTMEDAFMILQKHGYEETGLGKFSKVFKNSKNNYILKLFHAEDYPYIAYINLVKNSDNLYFPKINGNIIKVTPNYSAIRLEILSEPTDNYDFRVFRNNVLYYITMIQAKNFSEDELREMYPDLLSYMDENLQLKEACKLISSITNKKIELDINSGNIMMRGSQYVIIDPVYSPALYDRLYP